MGKGLPKKYAAMGFKKGWREYKKTKRKTSAKRKSSPTKKSKSSTRRYTRRSNPGGGARTEKLGALFRKIKAVFNITSGAQGSATDPRALNADAKMRNALARYTGVRIPDVGGAAFFNIDYAVNNWKGMGTEIAVQWADGKTRHFGNMSRGKLLDLAEELMPMVMAHTDAAGESDYLTQFARQYHKYTQGYDMHDGEWGSWSFDHMKPYATIKVVRMVGNKTGIIPRINRFLPKGVNL